MDKPAFPQPDGWGLPEDVPYTPARCDGLTRRELFAAMAMQGLCSNPSFFGPQFQQNPVQAALFGVEAADALITELNKEAVDAD